MTERHLRTTVKVIAVSLGERMDCCDSYGLSRVWVVVGSWSLRRAVLTHAEPFLRAAGESDPHTLTGLIFMARMDPDSPPPFEHEPGEQIEFPELELAPSKSEVSRMLGIPQSAPDDRHEEFDPKDAVLRLRAWLGGLDPEEVRASQVLTRAGDALYPVRGARFGEHGVELLTSDQGVPASGTEVQEARQIPTDFGLAMMAARHGCDIARRDWMDTGLFLRWDKESKHLFFHAPQEEPRLWSPVQEDVTALDWVELEEEEG